MDYVGRAFTALGSSELIAFQLLEFFLVFLNVFPFVINIYSFQQILILLYYPFSMGLIFSVISEE